MGVSFALAFWPCIWCKVTPHDLSTPHSMHSYKQSITVYRTLAVHCMWHPHSHSYGRNKGSGVLHARCWGLMKMKVHSIVLYQYKMFFFLLILVSRFADGN